MNILKILVAGVVSVPLTGCLTTTFVPKPSDIKINTAFTLGVDESEVDLREIATDGVRTRYKAVVNGKTHNCYVTGGDQMLMGKVKMTNGQLSDAVCNAPGGQASRNPMTGR